MNWGTFWEEDAFDKGFYQAVAYDYFRNFQREFLLDESMVILDFGCGPGYLASLLSHHVGKTILYDASQAMIDKARITTHSLGNVYIGDDADLLRGPTFDYILANSVIQYMSTEEFQDWLGKWANALTAGGKILISDVIPSHPPLVRELWQSVRFSLTNRCFPSLVRQTSYLFRSSYTTVLRDHPLTTLSPSRALQIASDKGLSATILDSNLTYNKLRYAVSIWTPS